MFALELLLFVFGVLALATFFAWVWTRVLGFRAPWSKRDENVKDS